eukprot:UC1_evm1s1004
MGAMRIAQTAGYGVLPSPELPNTFLAQAYDGDDAWGPAMGPCFQTLEEGGAECCDKNGNPILPPTPPPTPSPHNLPIQCANDTNWIHGQTMEPGTATLVKYGVNGTVPANSTGACCSLCSSPALQKLGCNYWSFYMDRSGPDHATCTLYATLGNLSKYEKWPILGGIRPFGPVPPPPPRKCSPANQTR